MISYYIDGINIETAFSVYVSASGGILGIPKRKKVREQSYADRHGSYVDLTSPKYESREIVLQCFTTASDKLGLINNINQLTELIGGRGLHRLEIALDGDKMLCYDVYTDTAIQPTKQWRESGRQIALFQLKLIEPNPVKRVYNVTITEDEVSITYEGATMLNFSWGDGAIDYDTEGGTAEHTYNDTNKKIIIVSGNVEDMTALTAEGMTLSEIVFTPIQES